MPKALVDPLHAEIAKELGKRSRDPLAFCQKAFENQPRTWQAEILDTIGQHLRGPNRHSLLKIAVASGHGVGKSALVGQIINWAMYTCEDCKVVLTANTEQQLRTKTWPEVTKWFNANNLRDLGWFTTTATAITSTVPGRERVWRADAISWSENNTEAFAGLHNYKKRIVCIFDEASAIAAPVWEVAEGAFTDRDTELIWLAFGNPTKPEGTFFECFNKNKHRWQGFRVDTRKVEGATNLEQVQKWVDDWGEDSDFVRIRVRGEFPRAGSKQLIGSDVVAFCRKYRAEGYDKLPKILSVDVARHGDDQSVVGYRQGRKSHILARYRGLDTVQVAERVIEFLASEQPDAVVVDGDGVGGGTVDHLKHRGFESKLFEFHGGQTPRDPQMYFNKRAECWGLMKDWLTAGAEIDDDPDLATDLTGPEYGFSSKNQIQLEKKEDMKKRGLASPDAGDMLAMTFSVTIMPKAKPIVEDRVWHEGREQLEWMA